MIKKEFILAIRPRSWKPSGLLLALVLAANPVHGQTLDFESDTPGLPPPSASFVTQKADSRVDVEVVDGANHHFPTGAQSLMLRNDADPGTPIAGFAGDLAFPGIAEGSLTLDFFPLRDDENNLPFPSVDVRLGHNGQVSAMGGNDIAIWFRTWRHGDGPEFMQVRENGAFRNFDVTQNFMEYNAVNSLRIDFANAQFQVYLNGELLVMDGWQSSFAMHQSLTHINHINLVSGNNATVGSEVHYDNIVLPESGSVDPEPELTQVFTQDFTQHAEGFASIRGGTIEQVASGTAGIDSRSGGFHALVEGGEVTVEQPVPGGVRTFYDDRTGEWPGGILLSRDVYVDVDMTFDGQREGAGFELTGTAYQPDGSWFRDFLFYVTAVSEGGVSISTGNGSSWTSAPGERTRRVTSNEVILTESGWYTLQHRYFEVTGEVFVEMIVRDQAGESVFTQTRAVSVTENIGNKNVGWFTFIDVDGGIAIDNVSRAVLDVPQDGYDVWAAQHFTESEQADASISGPAADPAGDGIENLIKYALGLGDPKLPSRAGLPTEAILTIDGEDYLTLTFTRPDQIDDVAYHVDASGDLTASSEAAVRVDESTQANGDGTTTYTYRDVQPVSAATARFLVLRVER